jgi:uncharacterized membrane protein
LIGTEAREFLMFYDLAENDHWPVGHGIINETAAFFDAWRWMRNEEYWWRERARKEEDR